MYKIKEWLYKNKDLSRKFMNIMKDIFFLKNI